MRTLLALLAALSLAACAAASAGAEDEAPSAVQTGAPTLLNARQAATDMERSFPELLHDAGVTGEVLLTLSLDADGNVTRVEQERSTHSGFDPAAAQVARRLRFAPARAGQRVRVRMNFRIPNPRVEVLGLVG
jgi:TonB family protein